MNSVSDTPKDTLNISIVGSGNVATHLAKAFSGKASVSLVNPHTLEGLPEKSELVIISVKDDAIKEVAAKLKGRAEIVAHTSGSVAMSALEGCAQHIGVFYPLQTFSKNVSLNYKEIPFFIEGSDDTSIRVLTSAARLISEHVMPADSAIRKKLHIAAVFACNFTNSLAGIADELLQEDGLDYKVMLPLLRQTVDKLSSLSPAEAQTGPAVRGDKTVMDAHLKMLEGNDTLSEIYRTLSARISSVATCKTAQ